jgi:hypothetical protein
LSRDAADQYDPEAEDEPLEELLCEYVGALYLDHDMDETPVGDPPDESTPPAADVFAKLDTDKVFQFPTAVSMIPDGAISDAIITQSEVASIAAATGATEAVQQDIFKGLSASIGTAALPEGMMAMMTQSVFPQNMDALSKIIQFSGFAENIATTSSMLSGLAEATDVAQPPDSLFADLATVQAAAIPTVEISNRLGGGLAGSNEHQPKPDTGGDGIQKEQDSGPGINEDGEPDFETSPDPTKYPNWEARIAESHIDVTPSRRSAAQNDIGYQMPVATVYSMVSEGETYQWLSSKPASYRTAIIRVLLYSVASLFGFSYPAMAGVLVDVIHGTVFESSDDEERDEP